MFNVGEEIVSNYLQFIKNCAFLQRNLYTPDVQGEIDVVGINIKEKQIYICEVAIHLITGLRYVKGARPNNVNKLVDKFTKDIAYANRYFAGYQKHITLWSPIVKNQSSSSKYNQLSDVQEIKRQIQERFGIEIELIINEKFYDCLKELRNFAKSQTKELKSPILRTFQIEEYTNKHIKKLRDQ